MDSGLFRGHASGTGSCKGLVRAPENDRDFSEGNGRLQKPICRMQVEDESCEGGRRITQTVSTMNE